MLAFVFLNLTSCSKTKEPLDYKSFLFQNQALNKNNVIKFTDNDTVFFQTRLPEKIDDYYTLINANDRQILNNFLKTLDLNAYDSLATNERHDVYVFALNRNSEVDWLFFNMENAPKELYNLGIWLEDFKKRSIFYPTKKTITYEDLESSDIR